jgi:alpha-tubulin suppressor-like RCC1 family protein
VDPVVLVLVHGWQVTGVTCSDVQAFDYSGESTWAGFISTFFPVGGGVEPRLRQLEVWKFRYMSRGKIAQVGADLADLINRRFAGRRVLILAHSKGGIIAAAAMLASGSSPVRGLITAGTPWNGTRAGELQNRLGMGCALFTSILPVECTRAQLAVIGAVDLTPAPSGDIAQLITPRLGMLLGRVSVIGSAITLTNHFPGPDPLWREFYDGLQFIVPGGPNDGLVPLSSSVPGSTFSPAFTFSGFNHSSYFSVTPSGVSSTPQAAIKNELIRWLDAIDPPLGPASMIVAASATNQSAPVNSSVTIAAKVTEASDRAIPGYVVTFSVTAGGGSFQPSGQTQVQVATGLDGTASTTWKLGPGSGTNNNTATASASGLVGSPVTFLASGSVGLISWDQVSGGGQHTCALTALGRGYCWGTSNNDVLGIDPSSTNWRIPNPILLTEPLSSILAGNEHTCALTVTGRAYCWGFNINGNVGDGTASPRSIPTLVVGQLVFAQIAVGQTHTCARTASGEIYCWGDNSSGQLGDGTLQTRYQPVLARGGAKFAQVVASGRKTCGRTSVGNVQCWGNVYVGMDNVVGYGFVDITAGYTHICGLTAAGRAYCWGEGGRGQLGGGTATFSQDPTPVQGGYTFLELLAGGWHTCGRTSASVLCWGYDFYGELGNNRSIFDFQDVKPTPFLVVGGLNFARIGAGDYHTCGRTVSGRLYCWGYNVLGQLGDNTFTDRPAPTLVLEP